MKKLCLWSALLFLLLASLAVEAKGDSQKKLDPLKHREARDKVDLNARKEYYRTLLKDGKCPPPQPPPDPHDLPSVPDSFITNIEIAFQEPDQQYVIYGQEMYDGPKKKGVLNYQFDQKTVVDRPDLMTENIIYNVKRNEAFFTTINDGCVVPGQEDCYSAQNCTAGTLDDLSKELEKLFGVVAHAGQGGFIGASSILEFGPQFNYSQREMSMCHGLECDVYMTCIEVPEDDATLLYTYYWSRPDWYLGSNEKQVPIAVEIYGDQIEGHTTKEIMRRYDFFDYKREERPSKDMLEVPPDIYCYGRKSEFAPPKPVSMYYMNSEIISGVDIPVHGKNTSIHYRMIYPQTEYYDYELKVSRQDYVPFFAFNNQRRFENQTSVTQDFNQGLAYVIQPRQRFCNITKILNITHGDVEVTEDGSVYMKSPWNYEELYPDMQYNGNHWTRGVDAGVWVGIKKNELGVEETYVWYFASPLTHEIVGFEDGEEGKANIELPTVDHVPIKMEKYITHIPGLLPPVTYNIYNYESEIPHVHNHDISLCYEAKDMRDLSFHMPVDSINKTKHRIEKLKYGLVSSVSDAAGVSPLRVNRLSIKEMTNALQVNFTLLERPDKIGDVEGGGDENTLNQAYNTLVRKLDKSQLIVVVNLGNFDKPDLVQLVALPHTMKDIVRDDVIMQSSETSVGYAPGDMAALGISMTVIGGIAGYALLRAYYNKK